MGSELSESDSDSDVPLAEAAESAFVRQWTIYAPETDADNVSRVMVIVGWPRDATCTKDNPIRCRFKVRRYGFLVTR